MNIHGGRGRSSQGGCFALYEMFVVVVFFSLWSEVHTLKVEWSFISPYQLSQQNQNWYALQDGERADIDFSKGGQVAFVPAGRYGLYNRLASPREINIYTSPPKRDRESSSSEEHRAKKKHHASYDYAEQPESEYQHPQHVQHHETPKEHLNNEHAEQAEISGAMADGLNRLIEAKRSQMQTHIELRDEELNRGNVDAAKMEQALVNIHQKQLEYLEGIEKAEEAIMTGEIQMYYDDDGAGQEHDEGHGHHGHHKAHHGHDGGHEHHHHEDEDEEHGNHHHRGDDDEDDEGHEHHHGGDDEDEEHEHHHGGDDEDEEHEHRDGDGEIEGHEHHHGGNNDDDGEHEGHGEHDHGNHHEGHGEGHEGHHGHDGHGHEGHQHGEHEGEGHHGNQDENEFHDATDNFEDDAEGKHKLDRRSPFQLPSFSSTDTATPPKTTDTTPVDTTVDANAAADASANAAKVEANAAVNSEVTTPSPDPSSTAPSTTEVSATANAAASATSADSASSNSASASASASSSSSTTSNSNSGWFSWLNFSNNTPVRSPYSFLTYISPSDKSMDNLMSMFNVFSDPSNSSYLSNASTLMRVVMFFMPGTGIVDQVQFTMALSKIMWEAATMYYEGYGPTEIAVLALGEMAEASYLARRSEDSIISQKILKSGETVKIDGMDVPAFLKYIKTLKYPDLTKAQEEKLKTGINNLVTTTYPNLSPELKATFEAGLEDCVKFLALFNAEGDLKVDNFDVSFSEVYINMHSAYEDSTLEKIKKSILSTIDAIKSKIR